MFHSLAIKEELMTIKKKTIMEKQKATILIGKKLRKTAVSKKEAESALLRGAKKVRPSDVVKVLKESKKIEDRFKTESKLRQFVDELKLLLGIVGDYWSGKYRGIPYWSIAAIVAALLYVLAPIDIIPDFIPVFGYVDDATVVAACIAMVRQDLQMYKEWKTSTT